MHMVVLKDTCRRLLPRTRRFGATQNEENTEPPGLDSSYYLSIKEAGLVQFKKDFPPLRSMQDFPSQTNYLLGGEIRSDCMLLFTLAYKALDHYIHIWHLPNYKHVRPSPSLRSKQLQFSGQHVVRHALGGKEKHHTWIRPPQILNQGLLSYSTGHHFVSDLQNSPVAMDSTLYRSIWYLIRERFLRKHAYHLQNMPGPGLLHRHRNLVCQTCHACQCDVHKDIRVPFGGFSPSKLSLRSQLLAQLPQIHFRLTLLSQTYIRIHLEDSYY